MNDWLRVFGHIPPAVDHAHMCPCSCHHILRNIAGTVVIEGRLGVLEDETDYVVACAKCTVKHHRAIWLKRKREAGR